MSRLAEALGALASGRDLSSAQAQVAVAEIMEGSASEAAIAAFLTGLRVKGETADELAGAVAAVRERMAPWGANPGPVLDTCGTGGDGAHTVNVSTAAAIVVAACGVPVAKHGNRSASGNCGSAEVLEALGVAYDVGPDVLARCLAELGIAFLFAPKFHPALRFAAPVRRQLPFRTLFNLVGPLTNPARPEYQLVGVPDPRQAGLMADALARLGIRRGAIVTGADRIDEVSLAGPTRALVVEGERVEPREWTPDDFGLDRHPATALRIAGPDEGVGAIRRLLAGEPGPVRDVVLANAAAALWVAGRAEGLWAGVVLAAEAIDSGRAAGLLERWARLSRGD
jgi:anthranilate phosphoribosyltransferase